MPYAEIDIIDLTKDGLRDLGKYKIEDISASIQDFTVMPRLLKKESVQLSSGWQIQRNVRVGVANSARMTQLSDEDTTTTPQLTQQMTVPWRHMTNYYQWERRELLMNGEPAQILDILQERRDASALSAAELLETQFWSKPTDSTDELNTYGVPYWIVKNTGAAGFNGGAASGFTAGPGGLSPTTYPAWANYTSGYTVVTKADLIKKMRTAVRKTRWKSPIQQRGYAPQDIKLRLMVNEATFVEMETQAEIQNDNMTVKNDLSNFQDNIAFNRFPVEWVPKLDADTGNPVYGLDFSTWFFYILRGDNMRESSPILSPNDHNTVRVFTDLTYQVVCVNRRRNFVIAVS